MVRRQPSKLIFAGSNPVSRSNNKKYSRVPREALPAIFREHKRDDVRIPSPAPRPKPSFQQNLAFLFVIILDNNFIIGRRLNQKLMR